MPVLDREWRNSKGNEIIAHGWRVTPVSRALLLRWRLGSAVSGACVWNRPRYLVVSDGEQTRSLSVRDATQSLQLMAIGVGLTVAWLLSRLWKGE